MEIIWWNLTIFVIFPIFEIFFVILSCFQLLQLLNWILSIEFIPLNCYVYTSKTTYLLFVCILILSEPSAYMCAHLYSTVIILFFFTISSFPRCFSILLNDKDWVTTNLYMKRESAKCSVIRKKNMHSDNISRYIVANPFRYKLRKMNMLNTLILMCLLLTTFRSRRFKVILMMPFSSIFSIYFCRKSLCAFQFNSYAFVCVVVCVLVPGSFKYGNKFTPDKTS